MVAVAKTAGAASCFSSSRNSRGNSSRGRGFVVAVVASPRGGIVDGGRRGQVRPRPPLPLPPSRPAVVIAASPASAPSTAAAAAVAAAAAAAASTPIETKLGPVTIRPLTKEDSVAASVVLVRAFAANGSSPPLADVEEWLEGALQPSSETAVLVAQLVPSATTGKNEEEEKNGAEQPVLLAPGRTYRVAGVAAVATTSAAAEAAVGSSSSSPLPYPLLCNVAVDPRLRRLGIGRALVGAAEAVAREKREGGYPSESSSLFVVARGSEDAAAERLYCSLGFAEVVGDGEKKEKAGSFFASLFGAGSRAGSEKLMKKEL